MACNHVGGASVPQGVRPNQAVQMPQLFVWS